MNIEVFLICFCISFGMSSIYCFFMEKRNLKEIVTYGKVSMELMQQKYELCAQLEATYKRIQFLEDELFKWTGKNYGNAEFRANPQSHAQQ